MVMFYRTTGSLAFSYDADRRLLRHALNRWVLLVTAVFAAVILPLIGSDYIFDALLTPLLALSLAAVGLNILTGYAGQLSLGTSAFMAVGAFAAYNFNLRIPGLPFPVSFVLGGIVAALVGVLFGLPSLRLRGFYLAVSTLAAQFFVQWTLTHFSWLSNNNSSGVITAPKLSLFGIDLSSPAGRYELCLAVVAVMTYAAARLARSQAGRNWVAVRDMEIAAAVIGVPVFRTKLTAFAISSFYCGIAGALFAFAYLGTVEPAGFNLERSFQVLFMIIVGGLGSIRGSFFGATLMLIFPLLLSRFADAALGGAIDPGEQENIQKILFGALIIVFLIAEPLGLASLWKTFEVRLHRWPFRG
jgi:branched-chain amino acid transport system permease protein